VEPSSSQPSGSEAERLRTELARMRAALDCATTGLQEAVAQERRRLAQTLHDSVCQNLTAAYFIAKSLDHRARETCPEVAEDLSELGEMIHGIGGELRDIMQTLRTPADEP
jgi:signal transduction histidine kinase